jgi:hypothetical protein
MIKLVGFGVALLMGLTILPARAMDGDVEFLQQLGGTVVWQKDNAAIVRFEDGTKVVVDRLTMAVSDAEGNTYISNQATNSIAVKVNGDLIEYENPANDRIGGTLTAALE